VPLETQVNVKLTALGNQTNYRTHLKSNSLSVF
jgi:hypothetical protein